MHSALFLGGVTVQYSGRQSNPRASMPEMTEVSKEHTNSGGPDPGITTSSTRGGYPLLSRSPSLSLSSKGCRAIQNARLATCDIVHAH